MGSKIITFGECAQLIKDSVQPDEVDPETPYIGLQHIAQDELRLIDVGKASDVSSTKFKFKRGDILFGKLRPYFRKVIIAPFTGVCSTDIWVVRATSKCEQVYLYYWMASQEFVDKASQGSEGTKMPRAKWDFVTKIQKEIPDLKEQVRIGKILKAFEDKIELNQRMNETLEGIARAVFQSWFVDFDPVKAKMAGEPYPLPDVVMALFPDELVESEMGMIPKGWEVEQLKKFGKIVTGKTPSTKNSSYYDSKDIPFIKIPDMHDQLFITSTTNNLSKKGADSQIKKYLPANSICVSCIATPGLVAMTTEMSQTNQQINSIIPYKDKMAYYLLLTMANKGEQIRKYGSGGSVVSNLNKTDFSKIFILAPDDKVLQSFNKRIRKIFEKIIYNQQEFSLVRILRDTMLSHYIN